MASFGRYELVEVLGQGGFATVHKAHDPVLDRDLAIKVLHGYLTGDDQVAERFVREGRALARIRHPNLVQVYDAGNIDNQTFLAMEFVAGKSLQAISTGRQVPLAEAANVIEQIAGAIDAVHATGLIHRDIKPANIIVEPSGRAVLLDLGIARDMENTALTATGLVVGTPGFLAPEQVDSSVFVGPRTDVYQLAATAYTLLAGKPPYEGDTAQVLYSVAHKPPPDLSVARPDLPYHAIEAVTRALAKDPAERPATATEFAAALRGMPAMDDPAVTAIAPQVARSAPALVQPAAPVAATVAAIPAISPTVQAPASAPTAVAAIPAAEPAVGASTTAPKATSASRSKTPLLVGLGVVAALIVGVLAFALLSGDGDDGGDTASAEEEEEDTGLAIGTQSGDFRIGEFVDLEIGPGEDTLYAFDAPPSGFVSFLVDEGDYPGYYRVVDARGKDVASATWIPKEGGMVDPVKLPAVGSYQLQFTPEEPASGSIRVAMYEVPIPKAQEISAGGDEVEMSVDVPGGLAVATFSAEAGERYSITTEGSTRGYYISVRTLAEPRRFALESKWTQEGEDFVDVFVVGVAGDYEIVADPEAADELTSYIRLFLVGDDQVTALTAGEPVEFSTSNPGENAIFTFSGKRDQVVSIRAWDLENGSQILLKRAGVTSTTIESQWAGAPEGALITATLPADADYVITLDGNEANTDAGKVAYYDISKRVTGLVQLGGPPATLKTTAPGQQAVFGLRAAGGEMITMRVLSDDDAYVSVVGPNGNKIIDRQFVGGGSEEKFQRPLVAGDYVILFEPYSPEESTFTIELKSSS